MKDGDIDKFKDESESSKKHNRKSLINIEVQINKRLSTTFTEILPTFYPTLRPLPANPRSLHTCMHTVNDSFLLPQLPYLPYNQSPLVSTHTSVYARNENRCV